MRGLVQGAITTQNVSRDNNFESLSSISDAYHVKDGRASISLSASGSVV